VSGASGYASYAAQLRKVVDSYHHTSFEAAAPHLDGYASVMLRDQVPLTDRRRIGAFFTGTMMRAEVTRTIQDAGYPGPYFDAACGAGDLLLAAAETLPQSGEALNNLEAWTSLLWGRDSEAEFADVARLRLRLAAASAARRITEISDGGPGQARTEQLMSSRHQQCDAPISAQQRPSFRQIRAGDGLARLRSLTPYTGTLLLNPPFGSVAAESDCSWGEGRVPRAAVFIEAAVRALAPGAGLIAILPDVLRSGSRLRKWRQLIQRHLDIESVQVMGQFDEYTDVDVFLLAGRRRTGSSGEVGSPEDSPSGVRTDNFSAAPSGYLPLPVTRNRLANLATATSWSPGDSHHWSATATLPETIRVSDLFEVRTGSVVDNRDPCIGPTYPFLTARSIPACGTVNHVAGRRQFLGTVRTPPLVVVRRTNRPTQSGARAQGVLVISNEPVAIDNHLLVALPRDGRVETCRALIRTLASEATSEFLDLRIRCRHLTVGALGEVRMLPDHLGL
jgi:hypothetical protein